MISTLRADTEHDHQIVDDAFATFDLSCADSYGRFLTAHARVLPSIEHSLRLVDALPSWNGRMEALAEDLAALGLPLPPAMIVDAPRSDAEAFGIQYVVQGARLGGRILSRRVGIGLPKAYLSDGHRPGEWRDLLVHLTGALGDDAAYAQALAAARRTFAAFRDAALADAGSRDPALTRP